MVDYLKGLSPGNYLALGLMLSAIGMQLSSLHSWQEAASPGFIGGTLAAIAAVLTGIGSRKPESNGGSRLPIWILLAALGAGAFTLPACAGGSKVPDVPAIVLKTDQDVK